MRTVALILLLALDASAATYYVATNGNDGNAGSVGSPWLTQQHAFDTMVAGDTCLVQPGIYSRTHGPDTSSHAGATNNPITMRANGAVTNLYGVSLRHSFITYDGFTFANIINTSPSFLMDGDIGCVIMLRVDPATGNPVIGCQVLNCSIIKCDTDEGSGTGATYIQMKGTNSTADHVIWGTNGPQWCVVSNCYLYFMTNSQFVNIAGAHNTVVNNRLDLGYNGDFFFGFGLSNTFRGNICTRLLLVNGAGGFHPDFFQTFGSGEEGGAGYLNIDIESYGHLVENNFCSQVEGGVCQLEWYPVTNTATIHHGNILFRNNVYADHSSVQAGGSISVPEVRFVNCLFYNCRGLTFTFGNVTNWQRHDQPLWPGCATNSAIVDCAFLDPIAGGGYAVQYDTNWNNGPLNFYTDYNYVGGWNGSAWTNLTSTAAVTNLNNISFSGQPDGWFYVTSGWLDQHLVNGGDVKLVGTHPGLPVSYVSLMRPMTGSVLVDAGTNACPNDFEGFARPFGSANDIGPFEFDPNLRVHFDFDEGFESSGTVVDVTGYGHYAQRMDATNWATADTGIGSTRAWYGFNNGVMTNDPGNTYNKAQYAAVTNNLAANDVDFLTNGTISVWFKLSTNAERWDAILCSDFNTSFSSNPTATTNCWVLQYGSPNLSESPTGEVFKVFTTGDNNSTNGIVARWNHVRDGATWHHLAVTWNHALDQFIAYDAGLPISTNTYGSPYLRIDGGLSPLWISLGAQTHQGTPAWGDDPYPNFGFFRGWMDEVRLYNRALTAAEVLNLYAASGVTQSQGGGSGAASSAVLSGTVTLGGTIKVSQ